MSPEIEACVESILADNPDMDKSTAYAICYDEYNTEKMLEAKEKLGLSEDEFINMVKML